MSLYKPQLLSASAGPLEEPEETFTPPPRMSDGRLVPVGLCPFRVARQKERRARWGALRAVPRPGGTQKAPKSAMDRL